MKKPSLPASPRQENANPKEKSTKSNRLRQRAKKQYEKSDVLISAVISTYLLTHLHHVLQRAEYGASKEGRTYQAANFAQLRKVLCMDARSMEDAAAKGMREENLDDCLEPQIQSDAA